MVSVVGLCKNSATSPLESPLVPISEAAHIANRTPAVLRKWIERGKLTAYGRNPVTVHLAEVAKLCRPNIGREITAPDGIDSLLTIGEAADLCGLAQGTIRSWVSRGKLAPSGLDGDGRRLYRLIDVARVEKSTRQKAGRA